MRRHPAYSAATRLAAAPLPPAGGGAPGALVAATQPLLDKVSTGAAVESSKVARAWEFYDTPEVRFACRQYSNAFASAKLVLGRRRVVGRDPEPIAEPETAEESKAYELLQSFAGGPEGQAELLDRMGTYFVVPGDMVLVGALDPNRMVDGEGYEKFAKWDVWSTTEVRWDGQRVHIQDKDVDDPFQELPEWVRHVRVWNRHPRRGWESDSPVLSAMGVLELIGLYDDRLAADAISRLIGAGVWFLPQGLSLPTSTGDPNGGTPADFLNLMKEIASLAIKDRRSPAATLPILVEAAAEDIAAAKDGHHDFSTKFDEHIGDLQDRALRRWATGVDFPAEVVLGLAQATHWNASLISEDKVQSFVIPSLRRACGNLTTGWLRKALAEFDASDPGLVVWFDPAGIKTRVDTSEEAEWAHDRFLVDGDATRYALGLHQAAKPEGDALWRQMLLQAAAKEPKLIPWAMQELGYKPKVRPPEVSSGSSAPSGGAGGADGPGGGGRPGPQEENASDQRPGSNGAGRTARLSTKED